MVKENNKPGERDTMRSRRILLKDGRYMIFYTFGNLSPEGSSTPSKPETDTPSLNAERKNV